jgi:hypothetical protein
MPTAQMSSGGFPTNFNDLEDNQIHGPVTMSGYQGVWGGIIRNVIRGPMIFTHNKQAVIDEWDIGSNLINGFALCSDNVPPPNMGQSRGAPSIVRGPTLGDQAATCTGVPDGITGPPPAASGDHFRGRPGPGPVLAGPRRQGHVGSLRLGFLHPQPGGRH